MKHNIECTIKDLVADFLYYDRKEDENLGVGDIEKTVEEGIITEEEIVKIFADEIRKAFK